MADIVAHIARQVLCAPPLPVPQRFEVADLLARVDAALARRTH